MKLVKEQLNEFKEHSDPIGDLAIGIPDHSYAVIGTDWQVQETADQFTNSLKQLGIFMTQDPTVDPNDGLYAFILSKKKLTKGEIDRIVEQRDEYGLDD